MVRRLLLAAGVGLLAPQLVPYGWFHPNPAITEAAVWPTPEDGEMPPRRYTLDHPSARLSAEETAVLVAALEAMDDEADGDGDNSGPGGGG